MCKTYRQRERKKRPKMGFTIEFFYSMPKSLKTTLLDKLAHSLHQCCCPETRQPTKAQEFSANWIAGRWTFKKNLFNRVWFLQARPRACCRKHRKDNSRRNVEVEQVCVLKGLPWTDCHPWSQRCGQVAALEVASSTSMLLCSTETWSNQLL